MTSREAVWLKMTLSCSLFLRPSHEHVKKIVSQNGTAVSHSVNQTLQNVQLFCEALAHSGAKINTR